jgi:tetratricopeptide (TPR) repeat protein
MAEINKGKILKEALEYQRKGQHDRALDELRKIIKVHPQDTRTLQKIAELQSKKGDRKEAAKTYIQLAELYEKDGFVDFAISIYKMVLKVDDQMFNTHLRLGELFLKKNLKGEALSYLQTALKLCSDKKKVRERIAILEKMIEASPEDVLAIENLADHYYYDEGKADSAKNFLRKASEITRNASDFENARRLHEKVLNIDSKDELTLKAMAELEISLGKHECAVDIYEKILEFNPNGIEILKKAAEIYRDINNREKAMLYLRRLADIYKSTNADTDLAEVYKEILNFDPLDLEAVEFMNRENTTSEIEIKEPPQTEWGLEIGDRLKDVLEKEGVSLSNESNPPSREYSEKGDDEPMLILDNKAQETGPKIYSNLFGGGSDLSSGIELDRERFPDVEMVDEKELNKTRLGEEEGSNVLDISGKNYVKGGEARTGIAILKELTTETLKKNVSTTFYERGIAYKDMNMTEQAVTEFKKSIKQGHKVPESFMMIGLCFLYRGDERHALRWFQKGLTLDGLAIEYVVSLKSGSALALGALGNFSEAVKVLEEIITNYERLRKSKDNS